MSAHSSPIAIPGRRRSGKFSAVSDSGDEDEDEDDVFLSPTGKPGSDGTHSNSLSSGFSHDAVLVRHQSRRAQRGDAASSWDENGLMLSSSPGSGRLYTQLGGSLNYLVAPVSETVSSVWSRSAEGVSSWWSNLGKVAPPQIQGAFDVRVTTLLGDTVEFAIDNALLQENSGSFLLVLKRLLRPHAVGGPEMLSLPEDGSKDETLALVTSISVIPRAAEHLEVNAGTPSGENPRRTPMVTRTKAVTPRPPVPVGVVMAAQSPPRTPKAPEAGPAAAGPVDFQLPKLLLNEACSDQLAHLNTLVLEGHHLSDFPADLGCFRELTSLLVSDNKLSRLPPEFSALGEKIETLEVHHNQITAWPTSLKTCAVMRTLRISNNLLKDIPDSIGNMKCLRELHIHHNRINAVSAHLNQCSHLRVLSAYHNALVDKSFPEGSFSGLNKLETILLHDNQLSVVPPSLVRCEILSTLDLSSNLLTALPEDIGSLCNLETLKVARNKLSSVPASIGVCQKLAFLDLSHNELTDMPAELGSGVGPALHHLNLENNKLQGLPLSTRELTGLIVLRLGHNQFEQFPVPEIGGMTQLTVLDLCFNPLVDLPSDVVNCLNLADALFSNTRLTKIPEDLHRLQNLRILDLSDCALEQFPDVREPMPALDCLRLHVKPLESSSGKDTEQARVQLNHLPSNLADNLSSLREITVADVSVRISRRRKQLDLPLGESTELELFAKIVSSCPHTLLLFGLAELASTELHAAKFAPAASELVPALLGLLVVRKADRDSHSALLPERAQDAARALAALSDFSSFQEELFDADGFRIMWTYFESTPPDEVTTRMSLLTSLGNLGFNRRARIGIVKDHSLEPFVRLAHDPHQMSGIAKKTRRLLTIFGVHDGNESLMCDLPNKFCWCGSSTFGHHHDDSIDHIEHPTAESQGADSVHDHDHDHRHSERGIRILALDGGGMRAVVTIEVLLAIEAVCKRQISDIFDMIAGCSTGGILASMIGLRGYTIKECETLYSTLGRCVFVKPGDAPIGDIEQVTRSAFESAAEARENLLFDSDDDEDDDGFDPSLLATGEEKGWLDPWSKVVAGYTMLKQGAYYSGEPLSRIVASQIGHFRMIDSAETDGCPRVVIPSTLVSVFPPQLYVFRNYEYPLQKQRRAGDSEEGDEFVVTELNSRYPGTSRASLPDALRATSAAPSYFDEFAIESKDGLSTKQRFVDGGLIANNPAGIAYHEARTLWPDREIDLFISLGTGQISSTEGAEGYQGVVSSVLSALTSPGPVDELLSDALNRPAAARSGAVVHAEDRYFRFDPHSDRPEGDVFALPLDTTHDRKLDLLRLETRRYLRRPEVVERLKAVAVILDRD